MLKKLLGIAPKLESDGSYSPSKLALKLATVQKTDFENISNDKYKGKQSKVLVIFTEQKNLKMQNGKLFSTGNHPVEALLPMLHLKNAGFDFEIATPTGKPVVFEMWAFPEKDEYVKAIYNDLKSQFAKPKKLSDFIDTSFTKTESYAAVFVPGGHGAMIGIPEDEKIGLDIRDTLVDFYASDEDALLKIMIALEFGVLEEERRVPILAGLVSGFLFLLGSAPSVIPFALVCDQNTGLIAATLCTGTALLLVGIVKSCATREFWVWPAIENLAITGLGGFIAYTIGVGFESMVKSHS